MNLQLKNNRKTNIFNWRQQSVPDINSSGDQRADSCDERGGEVQFIQSVRTMPSTKNAASPSKRSLPVNTLDLDYAKTASNP